MLDCRRVLIGRAMPGFSFLTQDPDPDQLDCSGQHGGAKDPGCPVWDGKAIYLSKARIHGMHLAYVSVLDTIMHNRISTLHLKCS